MPMRYSMLFALFLLILTVTTAAQVRSPLMDKIVHSVQAKDPNWNFHTAVCTCPALVRPQIEYAAGSLHYHKQSSTRFVPIYIAYVPTAAVAMDSMAELVKVNDTAPYRRKDFTREDYLIADEAHLWTYENGTAALYFRSGTAIGELFGAQADVQFFARTLTKSWRSWQKPHRRGSHRQLASILVAPS